MPRNFEPGSTRGLAVVILCGAGSAHSSLFRSGTGTNPCAFFWSSFWSPDLLRAVFLGFRVQFLIAPLWLSGMAFSGCLLGNISPTAFGWGPLVFFSFQTAELEPAHVTCALGRSP